MSEKIWSDDAWQDYLYWQTQDKKTLKRINRFQDPVRGGLRHDGGVKTNLKPVPGGTGFLFDWPGQPGRVWR